MPKLSKAPLIEIIFELRWGPGEPGQGPVNLSPDRWSPEERSYFPAEFRNGARKQGLEYVEDIGPPIPIPSVVAHRFRPSEGKWPCLQIGLGLFTVNLTNEFYDGWDSFRQAATKGLAVLDGAYPGGLSALPLFHAELRYLDGFPLKEQAPLDFMRANLQLALDMPDGLLEHNALQGPVESPEVGFMVPVVKPEGKLLLKLQSGMINGEKGLVAHTAIRSTRGALPDQNSEALLRWLDQAHEIQHYFFETLVAGSLMETFK